MDYFIDFANYKDGEIFLKTTGIVHIKRGQHLFGTESLADFIGVDRQKIRTVLKNLEKINFLTIKSTNKYSIATVINYDTYQPLECETNQQINQCLTSSQPAVNQQLTTPNKDNKEKKENIKEIAVPDFLPKDVWENYKDHRKAIKSKMTPLAEELAIKKLIKFYSKGFNVVDVINKSIEMGWKGIFEPKDQEPKINIKQYNPYAPGAKRFAD